MTSTPDPRWFKSSYSGGSGTECVECAYTDHDILIRDSKWMEHTIIRISRPAWTAFLRTIVWSNARQTT
ncbi:DUF397 domain-containing protein [Streptomyces sp. NPDC004065]|uniref:DUF397 domain-containing protein n=1 Tax=Streptomyces sp. NPDC004065 TaxID=3364689 RepID=UPI00384EBF32